MDEYSARTAGSVVETPGGCNVADGDLGLAVRIVSRLQRLLNRRPLGNHGNLYQ